MNSFQSRLENGLLYLFLALFALMIGFPYLWMLLTSFKTTSEIFSPQMQLFPTVWHVENYAEVVQRGAYFRYIVNSLIVTSVGVVLEVVIAFLGAYAFARLDFYGREFIFFLLLATLIIPPQLLMLPTYLVVAQLGWLNSYAGLIIPRAGAAFGILMLRQFLKTIPRELDDAAEIDGASIWQKIVFVDLPLCIPPLVTLALFSMIGYWNDYYWPFIITTKNEMRTLALGLAHFKSLEGMGRWELLMAASVLISLPVVIAFIVARKPVMKNMTAGVVSKG